jgi:peptidoglycan/LPS O-acetylase OafA/YrhL
LRFSETTASILLDATRGIAAVLVLLEHWRNLFFVDFPQVQGHRALVSIWYLLCSAGHQAVVVFFVLSGYLISGSVFRAFKQENWSWAQYLTHRLVRLWIALLPALILGACWDRLGIFSNEAPAMYSGANFNHVAAHVGNALSAKDFVGNIAFLQTIVVPAFGSNGSLWSLANEFWYYILFPLAACVLGRVYKKAAQVALCGLLLCGLVISLPKAILFCFPVWLLGAALHAIGTKPTALWPRLVASLVYAVVFLVLQFWIAEGGEQIPQSAISSLGLPHSASFGCCSEPNARQSIQRSAGLPARSRDSPLHCMLPTCQY